MRRGVLKFKKAKWKNATVTNLTRDVTFVLRLSGADREMVLLDVLIGCILFARNNSLREIVHMKYFVFSMPRTALICSIRQTPIIHTSISFRHVHRFTSIRTQIVLYCLQNPDSTGRGVVIQFKSQKVTQIARFRVPNGNLNTRFRHTMQR